MMIDLGAFPEAPILLLCQDTPDQCNWALLFTLCLGARDHEGILHEFVSAFE